MGVGFRRVNEKKAEKDVRKGERASVATAQTGINKGRRGLGTKLTGHQGWHIYKLP